MSPQIVFPRNRSKKEEWIERHSLKSFVAVIAAALLLILYIFAPRINAGDRKRTHAPPGIRVMELGAPRRAAADAPRIRLWDATQGSNYTLKAD